MDHDRRLHYWPEAMARLEEKHFSMPSIVWVAYQSQLNAGVPTEFPSEAFG